MSNNRSSGTGILGILFLIFLVLKLTGVGAIANWSWWWVTAPLWIPAIFLLAALAAYLVVQILVHIFR